MVSVKNTEQWISITKILKANAAMASGINDLFYAAE